MNMVVKALLMGAVGVLDTTSLLTTSVSADNRTGYVYSPDVSAANGGWNWLENGKPFTGFRFYTGPTISSRMVSGRIHNGKLLGG